MPAQSSKSTASTGRSRHHERLPGLIQAAERITATSLATQSLCPPSPLPEITPSRLHLTAHQTILFLTAVQTHGLLQSSTASGTISPGSSARVFSQMREERRAGSDAWPSIRSMCDQGLLCLNHPGDPFNVCQSRAKTDTAAITGKPGTYCPGAIIRCLLDPL